MFLFAQHVCNFARMLDWNDLKFFIGAVRAGNYTNAAARLAPGQYQSMPSGAGHDAQLLAHRMPAGMLFVPSIGGVSHHYAEDTAEADIVLGCEVLAAGVAEILGR